MHSNTAPGEKHEPGRLEDIASFKAKNAVKVSK